MTSCAEELRRIAGRMVAPTVEQAADGAALVEDFLAIHRLADEVERLEAALQPVTRRQLQGFRRARQRRLRCRIAGVIRRVLGH